MTIRDYFRLYTEEELAKGAELYFSGDLELTDAPKRKPAPRPRTLAYYGFGVDEKEKKNGEASYGTFPREDTEALCARWTEQDATSKAVERTASITIHKKLNIICEADCTCEAFLQDRYGCPHTAGLLTAYMARNAGEEAFLGTPLEEDLRNLTGVEDPFLPGVLKRTDGRLLSLLKGNEDKPLPSFNESVKSLERWRVECGLLRSQGRMLLELRAGYGKRALQVKDLSGFLEAYQKGEDYPLGKNELRMGRGFCDLESASLMDFLSGLLTAYENGLFRAQLFALDASKSKRYLILSGPEFDSFMKVWDGKEILVDDALEYPVSMDRKGLRAVLKKKAYGAGLAISGAKLLYNNGSVLYLYDPEGIFRVRMGSTKKAQELLSLLKWTDEELYIRESEIGAVLRNILPVFQKYGILETRGLDLEDYEPELPSFLFKLDYDDSQILFCTPYAVYDKQDLTCLLYDSRAEVVRRNSGAENEVASVLPEIFQKLDPKSGVLSSRLTEEELYHFMKEELPRLEQMGKVMATENLRKNRIRSLPVMHVGVSVESGHLLLSLQGTGLLAAEMDEILGAYRKKKKYFRLRSGEFLSMEEGEGNAWDTVSALYQDYGKKDPENIRIPAFRALYLEEMLKDREDASLEAGEDYAKLIADMDPDGGDPAKEPPALSGILRPYQKEGFRWIAMLKKCGFGGILADDMGLGKTLQVLSFLLSEKLSGKKGDELRTLVVCPASLVYNWRKELETYAGGLSCAVIAGNAKERAGLIAQSRDKEVWITSYDLLKRDIALYEEIRFANEIIDEAQFVKNQNTQAARSVRVVKSSFRLALTGTPIENYLSELWSIMDYLMPGFLLQYSRFQKEYETPIVAEKDEAALERLRKMVHPFILRRLKKQVLKELPDKLEEVVSVRMEEKQQKLYDATVEEIRMMLSKVSADEFKGEKLQYLSMLTKLRQICCDPSLLYENYRGESAKLEACVELVGQAVDGGHKLLIFSQFTTMLDIIGERLREAGIRYHRIDGSVQKEKRMQMVDSFANDDVPAFLISLKAGGTGLNLTAADIVIHYDPWWNQAAQNQATDRTHRIGQTRHVTVYELIVEDTVEEKIQKIKEGKTKLVEDVLTGEEIGSASFNREDMLELLT